MSSIVHLRPQKYFYFCGNEVLIRTVFTFILAVQCTHRSGFGSEASVRPADCARWRCADCDFDLCSLCHDHFEANREQPLPLSMFHVVSRLSEGWAHHWILVVLRNRRCARRDEYTSDGI